ncbi:hypothetical protein KVR01_010656 [Diaporthe batatas]|uniref:uncharacterized protein n=1 Tax=Diaporthe batatas TaxID=748121 RepID=UPI001D046557|nr:uncharacterized protein KVR01_010656 [Diaporthe batatas]KAG8160019.1 hypothetical protein KVR01_010656 [Diaporthe batatas]
MRDVSEDADGGICATTDNVHCAWNSQDTSMDRETRPAESEGASFEMTAAGVDIGHQHRRYSALQIHEDDGDELAVDDIRVQAPDNLSSPPSYHLLSHGQNGTTKTGPGASTHETATPDDDTESYKQHHDGGDRRQMPPRTLTPLTNHQIALLIFELLAVVAAIVAGIKGLVMLPQLNIFSVPPMTQDCGGYSVPAVERGFYINLQVAQKLSFTRAKLLDLAWDTVVGQGGRFLHAFVLYQVAASQLAWMMEYSLVPYYFQLDILFSTASLSALWSTLRFLGTKRPARAVFSAVWFLLAIVYVLAFSSIWGAATGYLSPSRPAYMMEDNSYVTFDSDNLNVCITVDSERLNGTVPAIVQGPKLSSCLDDFGKLGDIIGKDDHRISGGYVGYGSFPTCDLTNSTEEWLNIIAYSRTALTIQSFYTGANSSFMNESTDFNLWGYRSYSDFSRVTGVDVRTENRPGRYGYTLTGGKSTGGRSAVPGLYRQFTGFQFAGAGQEVTNPDTPWFNVTFELDPSIRVKTYNRSSVWELLNYPLNPVPYNSTLWWKGSAIPLEAPFLNFPARAEECGWYGVDGLCVCYQGTPLMADFQDPNNLICISEEGYVWGFSRVITLIGLILEVCWIIGCFGMWLDVHINSNLFRMNRRGSGVVRNILDIAGAIQTDLGRDTGAYGNSALLRELEKLPPVAYEVVDEGQQGRISIASMSGARRRGPGLQAGKLYA